MSLGRLNNPLYDEQGQFIGNQQPEANMFYGFNPTGAIGTGVSSGNVPAVANPLDSAPAGGGKGGGKGGGFAPPPPQNMYGGVGYNSYMGAGGIRPTSTPAFTSGFTSPAMTPPQGKGGGKGGGTPPPAPTMSAGTGKGGGKGGGMPTRPTPTGQFAGTAPDGSFNPPTSYGSAPAPTVSNAASALGQALGGGNAGGPEGPPPPPSNLMDAAMGLRMNFGGPYGSAPASAGGGKGGGKGGEIPDYMKDYAGSIGQPRTPPAGGGMFGGLANAANLLNQQRQRNDFINSDNELNRIRGAQMALERKARQEALNRSYYDQPEEPTVAQQPANIEEPAQPPLQFGDPGYMPTYNPSMPASRNPYDRRTDPRERFDMAQMERLNAAYRNRLERFNNPMDNVPEAFRPFINETNRRAEPASDYQLQQENFLKTRRLLNELGDPAPGMRGQRRQPSIGADAFGLAALMGGGNPFMR